MNISKKYYDFDGLQSGGANPTHLDQAAERYANEKGLPMLRSMVSRTLLTFMLQEAFIAGAELAHAWIKVEDTKVLYELEGMHHFLIPVTNNKTGGYYWDICTGFIDDNGSLISQISDEDCGWQPEGVLYYKPIGELPPLPTPPEAIK